jgi:hypothetical protein
MLSPASFFLAKKAIHLYCWLLEIVTSWTAVKAASKHIVEWSISIGYFQMVRQEIQLGGSISLLD